MNKKSLLSIILAVMMCFTLITPGAAKAYAESEDPVVTTEETVIDETTPEDEPESAVEEPAPAAVEADAEKPLPSMAVADGVVAGAGEYIMEYDENLYYDESWTKTFTTPRSCMLYFYLDSEEYSYAWYVLEVINNETGDTVYEKASYVDEETYLEDSIGLDPGSYTITFTNDDYYSSNHYYLDVYYEPLHTAEDPYYSVNPAGLLLYTGESYKVEAQVQPAPVTYETVTWSSENPNIATVDANGTVTAISPGETFIVANIDGHIAKCSLYVEAPTYTINATSATLYTGETKQLKLTVDPEFLGLDGLTWSSSNPSVASVNASGLVTAKAKGTTTITASVNGVKRTCKITVKPMALNKTTATVYVKKTQQLKVNGGTGTATWKSSNKKVATVTAKGVVKGIKPGTATITAKKNGKTFKCKVTVKWEPETGTVTTKTYTVSYNDDWDINMKGPGKISLTITNTDSGEYADNLDVTLYNPKIKSILSASVAPGKTKTVWVNTTAKGNFWLYCDGYGKVTVKKTTKPVLSKASMKVGKGYTGSLKAFGVKNGGKWSSSNKKIATVTSKGVVKGKKKGTCTIKYTLKTGKVLKCKVTVVNPVTVKVTSVQDEAILNDCWVLFNNYTNKKITYIEFNIKQYDGRGYRVSSPYDYYYMDYPLSAKSSTELEYWVNDSARKCTAYITRVWFADGSTWRP